MADKSTVLLVTPLRFEASWYKKPSKLLRERGHCNQAWYLDKKGSLQKRPQWATFFTFITGKDVYKVEN